MTASKSPHWILLFAVPQEVQPLLQHLKSRGLPVQSLRRSEQLPGERLWRVGSVLFHVTGMGVHCARSIPLPAPDSKNRPGILTCGFAGGLNPDLPCGQVLWQADPNFSEPGLCHSPPNTQPNPRPAPQFSIREGSYHHSHRVLITPEEKAEVFRKTGADAVEMESGILRQRCVELGLASATVRVVSDTAHDRLPLDFNRLMTPKGTLCWGRFTLALLRAPSAIPALIRFQRNVHHAAHQLSYALLSLQWTQSLESPESRASGQPTSTPPKAADAA